MSEAKGVVNDALLKRLGDLMIEADRNMSIILDILRAFPQLLDMDFLVPWGNEGAYNGAERGKRNFLCWVIGASKTRDMLLIERILNVLPRGARGHILSHQTFASYLTLTDGRFPQQATVGVAQAALLIDYGCSYQNYRCDMGVETTHLSKHFEKRAHCVEKRKSARIALFFVLRRKFCVPRDVAIYCCTQSPEWRNHLSWKRWRGKESTKKLKMMA